MKDEKKKNIVKNAYGKIARGSGCCSECNSEQVAKNIGYSDEEIRVVPGANQGLGCGNPIAIGKIREGEVVLDLGSGTGFDCFLAAKKVGSSGKVIGVDMTEDMIKKARGFAEKHNFSNVEFRLGDIENLPVERNSIDVIISNCVINLAPDKRKVFKETHRVLKSGGRMYVSDIVLLEELSDEKKNDESLLAGCVSGALLKEYYVKMIEDSGFNVKIISENKEISKTQYDGILLESLSIEAIKV
ncbi:MAG: arsenite methyltransferase [Nanoarchaeota archaeon]|nr:arsenite methyltransferase [Nanoarchaeota archaeon]